VRLSGWKRQARKKGAAGQRRWIQGPVTKGVRGFKYHPMISCIGLPISLLRANSISTFCTYYIFIHNTVHVNRMVIRLCATQFYFGDATNATLYLLNATNDTTDVASHDSVALREGDIHFGGNYGGKGPIAAGHVGIIVGQSGGLVVREAMLGKVVQNVGINGFCRRYQTVRVYRVSLDGGKTWIDDASARSAADKAWTYSGSYRLCSGNDLTKWYFSELVYKSYKYGPGINLDESFTDPRCTFDCLWNKKCAFVSPCDLIKGGKLMLLGSMGDPFDCSICWQGC
jgi:hypothetical protein